MSRTVFRAASVRVRRPRFAPRSACRLPCGGWPAARAAVRMNSTRVSTSCATERWTSSGSAFQRSGERPAVARSSSCRSSSSSATSLTVTAPARATTRGFFVARGRVALRVVFRRRARRARRARRGGCASFGHGLSRAAAGAFLMVGGSSRRRLTSRRMRTAPTDQRRRDAGGSPLPHVRACAGTHRPTRAAPGDRRWPCRLAARPVRRGPSGARAARTGSKPGTTRARRRRGARPQVSGAGARNAGSPGDSGGNAPANGSAMFTSGTRTVICTRRRTRRQRAAQRHLRASGARWRVPRDRRTGRRTARAAREPQLGRPGGRTTAS